MCGASIASLVLHKETVFHKLFPASVLSLSILFFFLWTCSQCRFLGFHLSKIIIFLSNLFGLFLIWRSLNTLGESHDLQPGWCYLDKKKLDHLHGGSSVCNCVEV